MSKHPYITENTKDWWYGFNVHNPAETLPGVTEVPTFAADAVRGAWVEFPWEVGAGWFTVAGQIAGYTDNGDGTVTLGLHTYAIEETLPYRMPEDAQVTLFATVDGYVTGVRGVHV